MNTVIFALKLSRNEQFTNFTVVIFCGQKDLMQVRITQWCIQCIVKLQTMAWLNSRTEY